MTASRPVLIVVDASVIAQWILPDKSMSPGNERLIADVGALRVKLLAPSLLMYELGSVLTVGVRRQRISSEDAHLAWLTLPKLGILFSDAHIISTSILDLSSETGVSAYDASYVALAECHNCHFYTADKRVVTAFRGKSDLVKSIDDYRGERLPRHAQEPV